MKIVAFSDLHADAVTLGHSRFEEAERVAEEVIRVAVDRKAHLIAFGGDLCDPDAGPIVLRCAYLLADIALEAAEHEIDFVAIAGNHDVVEDGSGSTSLTPLRALAERRSGIGVYERPGTFISRVGVYVYALPFAATSHAYDVADHVRSLRYVERSIFLSHLSVDGIIPGEETKEMARGREVKLPLAAIAERFGAGVPILQGHYHRAQTLALPGMPRVHVVGAPARFTFGEEQNEPSVLVIDL